MVDDYSNVTDKWGLSERVVSLSPSNTEMLFVVGAGDKVVGVTDHCNYPDELEEKIENRDIVRVGGYWNPSVEVIMDLKPDLVLASTAQCTVKTNNCITNCSRRCELTTKFANKLKSLGLNVLTLSPHSMDDVLNDLLLIGKVTGNSAQAIYLVETLKQKINTVTVKSKTLLHSPTVYFEVWNRPYISVNSRTWIGDLINLAGGTNIFEEELSEWPVIHSEDIIQRNPDIIVFPVIPGVPRFWGSFEAVKKRRGWKSITAVRDGRLFEVPRDFISRPGPRLVEALKLLEKMINPIS